jgi:hypothetical protein
MNKEKTVAMVLLDLCAFACYTDDCEDARGAFETACRLAEEYSLPELEAYREFVLSLEAGRRSAEKCKDN